MHHFGDIRLQKCRDLENRVRGLSRSLRMSSFDKAQYNFRLTFHSKHGPISCRFQDRRRFQLKMSKIFAPLVFLHPAEGVPLGIGYQHRHRGSKTRMMGLQGREINLTISSAVWIECMNTTDRQTPGHSRLLKIMVLIFVLPFAVLEHT